MSTPTFLPGKIPSLCSKFSANDIEMYGWPPATRPSKLEQWRTASAQWARRTPDWGGPDPRKDSHGGIDFQIQRQIKAYKKEDAPPKRVKPVPILIIIFIAAQAFGDTRSDKAMAIADMITIAFFFLLRPGEYTGTLSDDAAFKMQDVGLYIEGCKLDLFSANDANIKSATSAYYTFTTQKNGNRNEKLVQGLSDDPWCCPAKATVRRVLLRRRHKASLATPIASFYHGNRRTLVKAKDVTEVLRYVMRLNIHRTGISPLGISARSLRTGGAMALLHGKVDLSNIRMMGRWHSDALIRYLHVHAHPILGNYVARVFNEGTYSFLPDETVPIIYVYDDDL
jgi:hypothetical protein